MLNLFFKFRFILVLACLKNYKRHDAKFCSVKCFERVHVLQMSPVHVLQMSPVHVLQMSPVHVLQMSPVHVLQMSPVHVLQMSPVYVLQMSPVHVLQMSPVQVLQVQSTELYISGESTPIFLQSNSRRCCLVTELYYISGDRALAKKVWQKTWRISIPKVPLRSLDSCC